ncbi:MAG: hypothetical protein CMJ90_19735 [Planctomycetes bacterium]|nr:hypothetical protein [Planctomycetota bacterium]
MHYCGRIHYWFRDVGNWRNILFEMLLSFKQRRGASFMLHYGRTSDSNHFFLGGYGLHWVIHELTQWQDGGRTS